MDSVSLSGSLSAHEDHSLNNPDASEVASAAYPAPPKQYYSLYTDKNIADGTAPAPPSVITGKYSMFGIDYDTNDPILIPLETQNITKVYSDNGKTFNHKEELKKINHSIAANFVDLVEVLIRCPDNGERDEKLNDIETLFINMHHLINEYRPHQARETLRLMLDAQVRERTKIAERFGKFYEVVAKHFQNCLVELPDNYNLSEYLTSLLSEIESPESYLNGLVHSTNIENQIAFSTDSNNLNDVISSEMCTISDEILNK